MSKFETVSPIDGKILFTREHNSKQEIEQILEQATQAQSSWKQMELAERIVVLEKFVAAVIEKKDILATELTEQMGRPIRYSAGEIEGFEQRATMMLDMAEEALADIIPTKQEGLTRFIRREALGVVLVLSPWNYPYLTAVNAIIPALAAGNTVILKHSEQTALVAERLLEAAEKAGLPAGIFQIIHCTHEQIGVVVEDSHIAFVAFTGSVAGGQAVQKAASNRFIGLGLELGGKDPAYVRADADVAFAVENLVDGAFFNSGQSCCGVERIYVHESLYQSFVDGFAKIVRGYVLGDPRDVETTLGPMVRTRNADHVRAQIQEAIDAGAEALIDPSLFEQNKDDSPYLAPQVLINVNHSMSVMQEESFGPVIGIMSVSSDEEAVRLMNDSDFGLTASVWTQNQAEALDIAEQLETGTVFMNRCDYLDPSLAWVGVKNSGRGCTLSKVGYEQMTRPKSFHFRKI